MNFLRSLYSQKNIDYVLSKFFGQTIEPMELGGFSFHGRSNLLLQKLTENPDGSKTGFFDVYYLDEEDMINGMYGDFDEIKADLLSGKFDKCNKTGQVIIEFEEIIEKGEFYLKYKFIDTSDIERLDSHDRR